MLVDQPQSTFGDSPAWAQAIIDLLERPQTSIAAGVVGYTMLVWTVASVVAIIVEPMISGLDEDQSEDDRLFWLGCDMFFAGIFTIETGLFLRNVVEAPIKRRPYHLQSILIVIISVKLLIENPGDSPQDRRAVCIASRMENAF